PDAPCKSPNQTRAQFLNAEYDLTTCPFPHHMLFVDLKRSGGLGISLPIPRLRRKIPFLERLPERLDIPRLLLDRLRTILPNDPVLQAHELCQHTPTKLEVEPLLRVERHDERLALNLVLAVVSPQPDAEEVAER